MYLRRNPEGVASAGGLDHPYTRHRGQAEHAVSNALGGGHGHGDKNAGL